MKLAQRRGARGAWPLPALVHRDGHHRRPLAALLRTNSSRTPDEASRGRRAGLAEARVHEVARVVCRSWSTGSRGSAACPSAGLVVGGKIVGARPLRVGRGSRRGSCRRPAPCSQLGQAARVPARSAGCRARASKRLDRAGRRSARAPRPPRVTSRASVQRQPWPSQIVVALPRNPLRRTAGVQLERDGRRPRTVTGTFAASKDGRAKRQHAPRDLPNS